MKLTEALLQEHCKKQCDKIVKYIGTDRKRFSELVNVFQAAPYRVTQHPSWVLSVCVEKHRHLIKPHLKKTINNLLKSEQHHAVTRNTLRLLQFVEIPKACKVR